MADIGSDANSHNNPDDQKRFLRSVKAKRNTLLKQFCHLEAGAYSSDPYRAGWERIFGSSNVTKPPEPGSESGT